MWWYVLHIHNFKQNKCHILQCSSVCYNLDWNYIIFIHYWPIEILHCRAKNIFLRMDENRDGHLTEEEFLRVVSKTTSSRKCWCQTWSNNTRILTITWWIFNTKFLAHKTNKNTCPPTVPTLCAPRKKEKSLRVPLVWSILELSQSPHPKNPFLLMWNLYLNFSRFKANGSKQIFSFES